MRTLLVPSPQISNLIEDETGVPRAAADLVNENRDEVLKLYKKLHLSRKTGEQRILCELCGVPVYLCSTPDKQHFYFRHFHEDGNCPSVTRNALSESQINALRYDGQRESKRHIRLKTLLADSIRADSAFSMPVVEGTWKSSLSKDWRRPDVRPRWRDSVDVAFEIQLSTTFGRVMAEREVFYKSEGALLLWVFGEFAFDRARLMMEVIFANNNRNAFVVNEATREASIQSGALVVECCWLQPMRSDDRVAWTANRRLVRFDELTFDLERQRAFYVDTDKLAAGIEGERQALHLAREFEEFWFAYDEFEGRTCPDLPELEKRWRHFEAEFSDRGARLPSRQDSSFKGLLRALYLAKVGRAIGWDYDDIWPAAHRIHDAYKEFLWLFIPALQHYGRLAQIEAKDKHGKWAKKMQLWASGRSNRDPIWCEVHDFDDVVALVFPELAGFVAPALNGRLHGRSMASSATSL